MHLFFSFFPSSVAAAEDETAEKRFYKCMNQSQWSEMPRKEGREVSTCTIFLKAVIVDYEK